MDSNFEFTGERRNYNLVFIEVSSRKEYFLSEINYGTCTKDNVHMRRGDLVLLPCMGSTSSYDVWNIRENRIIKKWVSINDPIPDH